MIWTQTRFRNIEDEALAFWKETPVKTERDYALMRRYVRALQYLTIRRQRFAR